jgi:integrase
MTKLMFERTTSRINAHILSAALKDRDGRRLTIKDEGTVGLLVVINPTTASWRFSWRPVGIDPATGRRSNEVTVTLGSVETMSLKEARLMAAEAYGMVKRGFDPRNMYAAQPAASEAVTGRYALDELVGRYVARLRCSGISEKWASEQQRYLGRMLAAMGVARVEEISRTTVYRGLDVLDPRRPRTATALETLQRFCDFLVEELVIENNPARNLPKSRRPAKAKDRSRFFSEAELHAFLVAAKKLNTQRRLIVELLVAMPVRLSAIERLKWSHIDIVGRTWFFPGKVTKNGDDLTLHLNDRAITALNEMGIGASDAVVFSNKRGSGFNAWSWLKYAMIEAGFVAEDWGWHDLRRTFISLMAERDLADENVLDAALNHRQSATRGGVKGIYNRARRWRAHVAAMEAWSRLLDEIETGERGNVVAIGSTK